MDTTTGGTGDTGDNANAGSQPGQGQPAGNAGSGGNPAGANAGSNAPAAGSQTGSLDRSKLPALLQGMDEQQLGDLFDTMFTTLKSTQQGAPATQQETVRTVEKPPLSAEDIRKRFDPNDPDFDPMAVIDQYVERQYGGLITGIAGRTTANMLQNFRTQIPDFNKYEKQVLSLLQGADPRTITQEQILATYYAAKGAAITAEEMQQRNKPPTTQQPSTPETEVNKRKLSQDEEQVARKLFPRSADPIADYIKAESLDSNFEVKVPMGDQA